MNLSRLSRKSRPGTHLSDTPLFDSDSLLRSDTVMNAVMNRDRGFVGVNSYARDLRFDVLAHLRACVERSGSAVWYDACCGTGRALAEARRSLDVLPWGSNVLLIGTDLWPEFSHPESPGLRFIAGDVVTFRPFQSADLITCVHGIHYLGDKLAFLSHAGSFLNPGGVFVGHLDPVNLRLPPGWTWTRLRNILRRAGHSLSFQKNVLQLRGTDALASLHFPLQFRGAIAPGTKNFSGMTGVDSVYEV